MNLSAVFYLSVSTSSADISASDNINLFRNVNKIFNKPTNYIDFLLEILFMQLLSAVLFV